MKRPLITIALVGAVTLGGSAAHAQLAVYDATSYAKLIEQATTAANQLNELKTQVTQGQQLLSSLNDASGVSKVASALGAPSLRSFLPDTSALSAVTKGDFSALGAIGAAGVQNLLRGVEAPVVSVGQQRAELQKRGAGGG